MKKVKRIIFGILAILLYNPCAMALVYDFTTEAAFSVLHNQTVSNYSVSGVSLNIQAGITDIFGNFVEGEENRVLSVSPSTFDGLGVCQATEGYICEGQLQADNYPKLEAIVFNFDPLFIPEKITLNKFFQFEDIRIFTDGVFFGDYLGDETGGTKTIPLGGGGFSSMQVTAIGSGTDDTDYYVASIEGSVVPEPATLALFIIGLIGLAGFGRKKIR